MHLIKSTHDMRAQQTVNIISINLFHVLTIYSIFCKYIAANLENTSGLYPDNTGTALT